MQVAPGATAKCRDKRPAGETELVGDGGKFSTNGMSFERYIARQCLVADGFANPPATCAFKEIIVPLTGFEEWLRLTAIKVTSSRRVVSVKYKRPKDAVFPTGDGRLSVYFDIVADLSGRYLVWRFR